MDLYILRHAIAEAHSASIPGGDSQRRLTAEGEKKMRRIARAMKATELAFDLVLSSPYIRAKQTAAIVAEVSQPAREVEFSANLAPDGNPKELIDELRRRHGRSKSILLVGHEPYLSRLISLLVSGDTSIAIDLKKAGLCKLSLDTLHYGRCATLEWLLTPRLMMRMV
jgi:phosphohistidine phosphatase